MKKLMVKLLGNEKRQAVTIPIFAIVVSLIAGAIVLLALGKNPLYAYMNLLQGSGILPKAKYRSPAADSYMRTAGSFQVPAIQWHLRSG